MSNPVLDVMREANDRQWCVTPYCTTCGALDYRRRLREFAGPFGGQLTDSLADIDIQELMTIPRWEDALLVAAIDTPFVGVVLEAWLPKAQSNVRFADQILYNCIRHFSAKSEVRTKWIDSCLAMAVDSKDFSLVESLVLVLGCAATNYPELIDVAIEHARGDAQMKRVLLNACSIHIRQ